VLFQWRANFGNWEARGEIWLTKSHNKELQPGAARESDERESTGIVEGVVEQALEHEGIEIADERERESRVSLHLIASDCDFRMSALDCFFHP